MSQAETCKGRGRLSCSAACHAKHSTAAPAQPSPAQHVKVMHLHLLKEFNELLQSCNGTEIG